MLTNIRLDLKQDKAIDPSKCPICGGPNQCAQEVAKSTGKPQEPCWCMTATFSSELLDRVPTEAQNKACICEKCVGPEGL